jgi:hypothetical protein
MNILINYLGATGLIIALVLLRLIAERRVLETRIRRSQTAIRCEQTGCLRGCELDVAAIEPESDSGNSAPKRRTNHAP